MAEPVDRAASRRTPVILLGMLAALALLAAVFYPKNPLANRAQDYAQSVAVASAGVYVTLRTLNAFLSTAQEVEVGGSLVVSGTIQPLKTLEPIDDTIERVAGLVFVMLVVTGVLAVAMGPVSAVGATMIALALGVWILDRLVGRRDVFVALSRRLIWYGVFLGIAVPLAFLITAQVADRLTQSVWDDNMAVVAEITAGMEDSAVETPASFQNRLWAALDEADDYRVLAVNIYDKADALIGSYIAILAVFVFKVFVMPMLLLGAFFVMARFFAQHPT